MSDTTRKSEILKEAIDLISPKFHELQPLLNKYPRAFKIYYSEEFNNYILMINEDYLLNPNLSIPDEATSIQQIQQQP